MKIVYLHGFASGPQSSKATFFRTKFEAAGIPFFAPALDRNNFETLTVTGMLEVTGEAVAGDRVVLMGSSLGGFVAGLFAERHPELVEKLVLLAPALQFSKRWRARFTAEQMEAWKSRGWAPFFHYGSKTDQRLGYGFVEDATNYESEPDFRQPALILHGTQDSVVPVQTSREFAERHPNVWLKEFPSGHELTDAMDGLWAETAAFLGLLC